MIYWGNGLSPAGGADNPYDKTGIGSAGTPGVDQYQYKDNVYQDADYNNGGGIEFHEYPTK